MIICITDKKGVIHIADFISSGICKTICGKRICKADFVNYFAADNSIRTGCQDCHHIHEEDHQYDLDNNIRAMHNSFLEDIFEKFGWLKNFMTTEYLYTNLIERDSVSHARLQRKVLYRVNRYAAPNKRR
jgi:hypothetical protein